MIGSVSFNYNLKGYKTWYLRKIRKANLFIFHNNMIIKNPYLLMNWKRRKYFHKGLILIIEIFGYIKKNT